MRQSTYLRKVLKALETAGWWIKGYEDGGDDTFIFGADDSMKNRIDATMDAAIAVEDIDIYVSNGHTTLFLKAIWQGDDETYEEAAEVVSDYSMPLDKIISAVESE